MMELGSKIQEQPLSPKDIPQMIYPSINFNNEKIPSELMDKKVGEQCRVEIVLKVVSKNIRERSDGKKEDSLSCDVMKIKYLGKAGKKSREEYIAMKNDEREEYDREQLENEDQDDD